MLKPIFRSTGAIAKFVRVFLLILSTGISTSLCAADAYLPTDDGEVLETLPQPVLDDWSETTSLRRKLLLDPTNADLASDVAVSYLTIGNRDGDPRYFGYARAALRPWWDASDAPVEILRIRAKLKEKDHQYAEALADLQLAIEQQPRDVQAWVETANICRVVGDYSESLRACETLSEFAGPERTLLCRIPIQAVTGKAKQSYVSLAATLPAAKKQWPAAVQWVLTMQAQIACALGKTTDAERHFQAALDNDPTDKYQIRAYADFLLEQNRADEALSLVRDHVNDNGVLLRAAIAARRCGNSELASGWQAQLERRFDEIRLRGDRPHGRFESRYFLELKQLPDRALEIALANWEKQKEARDTQTVLESAVAAKNPAASKPVIDFLREHGTENVVFDNLIQRLEDLK